MMKPLLASALALLATSAFAEYPEKTVTIVIPFAAGGPTDKVGRDFAEAVRKPLGGQAVVIDNVAGAGGTLGTAKVARAAPDGYTLLITHIGMATSPALYRNLQFKPLEDFEYLGLINEVPMTLISRPTLAANNYAELATWIQANKGKVNIANAGLGSASHMCGMLLQSTLKADMTPVPYKGTAPAMNDLLGGQVDIMCDQTTNTTGQIEGKKVKAFAVTTPKRLTIPALAALPTLDEAGVKGVVLPSWNAIFAPPKTPHEITDRLYREARLALQDPEVRAAYEQRGVQAVASSPDELTATIAQDVELWKRFIRENNIPQQ